MLNLLLKGGTSNMATITVAGISFDVFVVISTIILLVVFSRIRKNFWVHFYIVALGVFIFEIFTSPMWMNPGLGKFAYVYQDVSWILTIGWSTLILSIILLIDNFFKNTREWKRFFLYMVGMSLVGFLAELYVVNMGLREYSPEVLSAFWGPHIWNVPIEAFYYIPVFSALVIGFYKYWVNVINQKAVVPVRRKKLMRSFIISLFSVLLFELMIEPMVVNTNLPEWSYIYHDISLLMTGMWIIIVWLSISIVDKLFANSDLSARFVMYVVLGGVFSIPVEFWFISNGYRVYGQSAIDNFSGLVTPIFNLPVEVIFAIPLYLALIIGFIRYWEIILDNK